MQTSVSAARHRRSAPSKPWLLAGALVLGLLALSSLGIGATNVSVWSVLTGGADATTTQVLLISRIPRTLALVLSGVAMAVAGALMQMLARNRFVEPSTAGTVESATLGLLAVALLAPELPLEEAFFLALLSYVGLLAWRWSDERAAQRAAGRGAS